MNSYVKDLSYNNKLLLTRYSDLSSISVSNYTHENDGRVKTVTTGNGEFDRRYVYDHAGRLTQGLSGGAAQNPPTTNIATPYNQTYAYDAMNNMTSRVGELWGHQPNPFTASYINDRNTAWTYDLAGNVKSDPQGNQYTYNTAGQTTYWTKYPDSIETSYDGEGHPAKRIETRTDSPFNSTIYYVRSSVMGGKAIAELNENGQRKTSYVYGGGMILARYKRNSISEPFEVIYSHDDPMTGDRVETRQNGNIYTSLTVDPLGGLVPGSDPYATNANPDYGDLLGQREGHFYDADPFDLGGGCTEEVNGVPMNCNDVQHLIDTGAIDADITLWGGKKRTLPVSGLISGIGGYWVYNPSSPQDLPDGRLGVSDVPAWEYVSTVGFQHVNENTNRVVGLASRVKKSAGDEHVFLEAAQSCGAGNYDQFSSGEELIEDLIELSKAGPIKVVRIHAHGGGAGIVGADGNLYQGLYIKSPGYHIINREAGGRTAGNLAKAIQNGSIRIAKNGTIMLFSCNGAPLAEHLSKVLTDRGRGDITVVGATTQVAQQKNNSKAFCTDTRGGFNYYTHGKLVYQVPRNACQVLP